MAESTPSGRNIGSPVVVNPSTLESGEHLTYEVEAAAAPNAMDVDFVKIDKMTGQLSLRKMLSAEADDNRAYTQTPPPTAGEYKVTVRATDPSNETTDGNNTDTILVTITATGVNESPKVTMGALEMMVAEKDNSKKETDDDYYTSLTEDTTNAYDASDADGDLINWRLEGVDASLFQIGTIAAGEPNAGLRQIVFRNAPDYEDPKDQHGDNVYHVSIVAYEGTRTGKRDVRIEVTNVDEAGKLELTPEQPHLEGMVMAGLMDYDGIMTDPDGVQTITSWSWYRTDNDVTVTVTVANDGTVTVAPDPGAETLGGENTGTYTIAAEDVGKFLHARVTYRDGASREDDPVTATLDERDGDDTANPVLDPDPDKQLIAKTMNAVSPEPDDGDTMETPNQAPMFDPASLRIEVPENTPSTGYVGSPVVAMDDSEDVLTYELLGANVNRFALAPAEDADDTSVDEDEAYYHDTVMRMTGPGQIAVKPVTHLDYEAQRNTFEVQVSAADSEGERGMATVTIVVTNVNEAPSAPMGFAGGLTVTGPSNNNINENETDLMVATYTAVGPQGGSATFTLSGADMGAFTMTSGGDLSINASPDYEMPADADGNGTYELMITARAGGETSIPRSITVTVGNVDEEGRVTFWRDDAQGVGQDVTTAAIMVGDVLTGLAEDPDGNAGDSLPLSGMYTQITSGVTWQWSKTMDPSANNWMDIAGETDAAYTVMDTDAGYFLRAMAMYTDMHGSGKDAEMATAAEVGAAPSETIVDNYDNRGNGDGMIQKLEYLAALDDFLDEIIERDDLLLVLDALIDFLTS